MSASTTSRPESPATTLPLRRVHLARSAFAVVWAGLLATTGSELGALAAVLLVTYPAVDAVAAVLDATSATDERARTAAVVGGGLSVVAAVGLAVAATDDITAVLRVFGAWAVVSGLAQLAGAVSRRGVRGQRFLVASGALSVVAGASFVASAADATSLTGLSGYAVLGGVFFLVSAIRLGRAGTAHALTHDTAQDA